MADSSLIADINRASHQTLDEATAFFQQYAMETGRPQEARIHEVLGCLRRDGIYEMTYDELLFATKLSWRNTLRCNGRRFWRGLRLRDVREAKSEEEVFEACVEHIRAATNGGKLVPMSTIFAPRVPGTRGIRIWNHQLIRYAGYRQTDGSVVGDPAEVAFTEQALRLGWKGRGGRFDLLPLIIQFPGREPKLFELSREDVLEVPLIHPEFAWFEELELRWYALPAISEMLMDAGGLQYCAAIFSGWYMNTEIASRNFGDETRYNLMPTVAARMGLDTKSDRTLWKDRALLELNTAVLYSFQKAGVKMVDHHTASTEFMRFVQQEADLNRVARADWSWIVPPMSGSACPVFHHTFVNEEVKPNFYYQPKAWLE